MPYISYHFVFSSGILLWEGRCNIKSIIADYNPTHFFFSSLWRTRRAEPNAPFPICSRTSYCSIISIPSCWTHHIPKTQKVRTTKKNPTYQIHTEKGDTDTINQFSTNPTSPGYLCVYWHFAFFIQMKNFGFLFMLESIYSNIGIFYPDVKILVFCSCWNQFPGIRLPSRLPKIKWSSTHYNISCRPSN